MPEVYVAAGSNVDPERNLLRALDALARAFPGLRVSPCYRNRAVGFEGEDFLNLVVGFQTTLPLAAVIAQLHRIEQLCGRERDAPKWEPRSMDLDILLYGDTVQAGAVAGAKATLPRPDLLKRAFMLKPLADLAPELAHPTANATIAELWARFDQHAHPLFPCVLSSPDSGHRPPPESGQ